MTVVQSVRLTPVSFPLKRPFVTAAGHKTRTDNLRVEVRLGDGSVGRAEASSSIALASESQQRMQAALEALIPDLRGRPVDDYRPLVELIWRRSRFHPTAAAAMETALLDAVARHRGQSLARFLSGKTPVTIESDLTLSLGEPNDMAAAAARAARQGFRRFKLKLSGRSKPDLERVAAVHQAVPRARLVLDGNQGFRMAEALQLARGLQRQAASIQFFEQPFPRLDLKSMRLFRQRTKLAVFADEAVLSADDAVRVFSANAADGVNVKVAKSGLMGALDIIKVAERFKKRLAIGCMEESKAGLAPSVHLACGTGVFEWIDLDSFWLLDAPPGRGGFRVRGPRYSVAGIRAGAGT